MQNTDFYHSLLHLTSDWTVARVETNHATRVIDVYLEYTRSDAPSPDDTQRCPIYDHRKERRWRHLDTMQYKTYLHARVPRIRLSTGEVVTIPVPWSEPHSHHSVLFEAFAIELLLATKNQTQSARLLRITFDQLHRIMKRAVARGESRRQETLATEAPATRISIDEKCYQRGYRYLTIVSNAETGQALASRKDTRSLMRRKPWPMPSRPRTVRAFRPSQWICPTRIGARPRLSSLRHRSSMINFICSSI